MEALKNFYYGLFVDEGEREPMRNVTFTERISDIMDAEVVEAEVVNDGKWYPNDKLYRKYIKAEEELGKVNNKLIKIQEYEKRVDRIQQSIDHIMKKDVLSPVDRVEILVLKQDMVKEQERIQELEEGLEEIQQLNYGFLDEYAKYMERAQKYIKDNKLTRYITTTEILNSDGIYVKTKSLMDGITVSSGHRKEKCARHLAILHRHFDLKHVHMKSRGRHLIDFKRFALKFGQSQETLFDYLDVQLGGLNTVSKVPLQNGTDGTETYSNLPSDLPVATELGLNIEDGRRK